MKTTEEMLTEIHDLMGEYLDRLNKIRKQYIDNPPKTPAEIMQYVADQSCVPVESITTRSRIIAIVEARQLVTTLFKFGLKLSSSTVGDMVGGFDHATVLHSINEVSIRYSTYPMYRDTVNRMVDHLFAIDEIREHIKARIIDPHIDRKHSYAKLVATV